MYYNYNYKRMHKGNKNIKRRKNYYDYFYREISKRKLRKVRKVYKSWEMQWSEKFFLVSAFAANRYEMQSDIIFNYFRWNDPAIKFIEKLFQLREQLKLKTFNFNFLRLFLKKFILKDSIIYSLFKSLFKNLSYFNYSFYYLHIMPFLLEFYNIYIKRLIFLRKKIRKFNRIYDLRFLRFLKKFEVINSIIRENAFFYFKFLFFFKKKIFFLKRSKKKIKIICKRNPKFDYMNSDNFFLYSFNFFLYKFILLLYLYWFNKLSNNYINTYEGNESWFIYNQGVTKLNWKMMSFFQRVIFTSSDRIYQGTYKLYLWPINILSFFYFFKNYKIFIEING